MPETVVASEAGTAVEELTEKYKVFEPLFEEQDLTDISIVFYNLQFIVRRILLILMAMYFEKAAWL